MLTAAWLRCLWWTPLITSSTLIWSIFARSSRKRKNRGRCLPSKQGRRPMSSRRSESKWKVSKIACRRNLIRRRRRGSWCYRGKTTRLLRWRPRLNLWLRALTGARRIMKNWPSSTKSYKTDLIMGFLCRPHNRLCRQPKSKQVCHRARNRLQMQQRRKVSHHHQKMSQNKGQHQKINWESHLNHLSQNHHLPRKKLQQQNLPLEVDKTWFVRASWWWIQRTSQKVHWSRSQWRRRQRQRYSPSRHWPKKRNKNSSPWWTLLIKNLWWDFQTQAKTQIQVMTATLKELINNLHYLITK